MRTWASAASLREQVERRWERGLLLAPLAQGAPFEPLRLTLSPPTSKELADRFEEVAQWTRQIQALPNLRIDWREFNHRLHGAQRVPECAWLDTLGDAVAFIHKRRAVDQFEQMLATTRLLEPRLCDFLSERPLRALELAGDWEQLLAVVGWLKVRPRPGIYLRQVDLPGVHTKFIDQHRTELNEILPYVLQPGEFGESRTGSALFESRFGFRTKPAHVRLRSLDPALPVLAGAPLPDIKVDEYSFARLQVSAKRVLMTENEINFLVLPPMADTIAVFTAGYGFDAVGKADWIRRAEVLYWGDIDTHGFAILDQLRAHVPQAMSLLMDGTTLRDHERWWGEERSPVSHDLPRLSAEESAVYDDLRYQRLKRNLRLEQEHIGFRYLEAALASVGS